jgi:rhodanese-related sulfurtransferase
MRSILGLVLGLALTACQSPGSSEPKAAIPELGVPAVAELLKTNTATVVDVNSEDIRKEYGVVPNALLLKSWREYAISELPAEKASKLVFYCGSTRCRASDMAAERAREAGYSDVNVMREGIRGWKEAGHDTATPSS